MILLLSCIHTYGMVLNNVGYTIEQRVFILQLGWKHSTNSARVIEEFSTVLSTQICRFTDSATLMRNLNIKFENTGNVLIALK